MMVGAWATAVCAAAEGSRGRTEKTRAAAEGTNGRTEGTRGCWED